MMNRRNGTRSSRRSRNQQRREHCLVPKMTSQSVNTTFQTRIHGIRSRPLVIAVIGCCILGLIVAVSYSLHTPSVFFTTSSPSGTYSVSLKGDRRRTFLLSHEVRADVVKSGRPFVSDIYMHSSHDAFDLSFEAGFPEARWLSNNVLEFSRQEYFERGSDSLIIQNSSDKAVKYLRAQGVSIFLIFDIEPGSSFSVQIPAPRGDTQSIAVWGAFNDNQEIVFSTKGFDRHSTQRVHTNYQIRITPLELQMEEVPTLPAN
jgi:hypothetical protein